MTGPSFTVSCTGLEITVQCDDHDTKDRLFDQIESLGADPHTAPTCVELLPCPFCGGEPITDEGKEGAAIACGNLKCLADVVVGGDNIDDATSHWNTRAAASPRLAGREEIAVVLAEHLYANQRANSSNYVLNQLPQSDQDTFYSAADAILSLLGPAPSESVGWRTDMENAPKEDPDRPGSMFEIMIAGGTYSAHDHDNLSFDGYWGLACWDDYVGAWRGENTGAHDEYAYHKPTHWRLKIAPPTSHASQVLGSDDNA